jgi:hypothetical protein
MHEASGIRKCDMNDRNNLRVSLGFISLAGFLLAILASSTVAAQEPEKGPDETVKNEIESFEKELAAKAPAEQLKALPRQRAGLGSTRGLERKEGISAGTAGGPADTGRGGGLYYNGGRESMADCTISNN